MLVPIPKKPGCYTSNSKNWRLIIIFTTLSMILELYIIEESSGYIFSDSQFGFIAGRGTEIATALVNDVKLYCNSKNSAVYSCSLDAEGAFDAIPHSVVFAKASTALPDHCWHVMVKWYKRLSVQIKWCNQLSLKVKICVGTRQGGLSSLFLFNMFYQDILNKLSSYAGGIQIKECRSRGPGSVSSGLTPTLREDWACKRALETPCHARIAPAHRTHGHVSGPLVKIDMGHCIRRGL